MEFAKELIYLWRNDQKRREAVTNLSNDQLHQELEFLPLKKSTLGGLTYMKVMDIGGAIVGGMAIGGTIRYGDSRTLLFAGGIGLVITLQGIYFYRKTVHFSKLYTDIERELARRASNT